ncbi:hypothetical protein PSSHI_17670 [Photobacterium sp. R1]
MQDGLTSEKPAGENCLLCSKLGQIDSDTKKGGMEQRKSNLPLIYIVERCKYSVLTINTIMTEQD